MLEIMKNWDRSVFLWMNGFHVSWLDSLMLFLSGQLIWLPMLGLFFWVCYRQHNKRFLGLYFLFLLLAIIASDVTSSYLIKNVFNRLRPCREEDLKLLIYTFGQKCGGKFGFVSSHAANSLVLTFFSYRALHLSKSWLPIFVLPLLVSYSRIYLGVHYPGDLLGGVMVGLFWGMIFSWLFKELREPVGP